MKYLLDTHVFLWWVADDASLSPFVRDLIGESSNDVFFSVVSAWEIAIKHSIGRLKLAQQPKRFVREQLRKTGFAAVDIRLDHTLEVSALPPIHSDPFDRLLAAQCMCDRYTLITRDKVLSRYPIEVVW